jgi:hypothetical protein
MTDTVPFGTDLAAVVADEARDDRNKKLLVGGAAALVVLSVGAFLLLRTGDASDSAAFDPVKHHVVAAGRGVVPVAPAKAGTKPVKRASLPAPSSVRLGRDPFKALYTVPVVVATTSDPVAGVPGATGATPSTGGAAVTGPSVKTYTLKLIRVYGKGADQTGVFTISGRTQSARVSSVFGPMAELTVLSFQQDSRGVSTAVLTAGDGAPVDAVLGHAITVR